MEPAGVPLTADAASKRNKLIYGSVLLAVAGVCGFLATLYGFMAGMGAAIFGISGISMIAAGFSYSGRGPCPTCGKELVDLPRDVEARFCAGCGNCAIVREARLFATPPDHVAKHSIYPVVIEPGTQPDFHGLCVTCGRPATTSLPRELTKTVALRAGRRADHQEVEHRRGAVCRARNAGLPGQPARRDQLRQQPVDLVAPHVARDAERRSRQLRDRACRLSAWSAREPAPARAS